MKVITYDNECPECGEQMEIYEVRQRLKGRYVRALDVELHCHLCRLNYNRGSGAFSGVVYLAVEAK